MADLIDEVIPSNSRLSSELEQGRLRKRQKVTRACDACKTRKKRCTGDHPCTPCLKTRGKCTYEAQYNRGIAVPPSPAPSGHLQSRDQASSTHVSYASQNSANSRISPACITPSQHVDPDSGVRRQSAQETPLSRTGPDRDTTHVSLASANSFPSGEIDDVAELHVRSDPVPELGEAIDGQYLGRSSAQSFLGQALRRFDRNSVQNLATGREAQVETEIATLSYGDARVNQPNIAQFAWPEYRTATRLLERFFEFSSPTYRYMHEPTMQEWLKQIYNETGVPIPARACILLIFASASVFTVDSYGDTIDASNQGWQSSEMYYQKAESLLSRETGPPCLESVQARFAAVQYLLSSSRPNKGLFNFGTMVQLMQAVGIHRRQSERAGNARLDVITVEIHRRLFWCAFTMDKYLSIIMGRMPLLHMDDTNQVLPMIVNDEDLTSEGVRQQSSVHGRDCLLHATLAHIKIGKILAGASEEQHRLPTTTNCSHVEAAVRRNQEIRDWQLKLTPILSGAVHPSSLIPCFRRQHSILTLARLHAIMFITRPLLLRDLSTDLPETGIQQYREQLRSCIGAAREAIENINGSARYRVLYPAFWFSQYIAFSAISIIHIYIIQLSRHRIPANLFDTTSPEGSAMDIKSLYELALLGQGRLAEVGVKSAPVWRYSPILESLSTETSRYVASQTKDRTQEIGSSFAQMPETLTNNDVHRVTSGILQANPDTMSTFTPFAVSSLETGALWMNGHESLWGDLMTGSMDDNNLTMDFWPQFDNLPVGML